ncbi:porin [Luteolibacter algae]|uniref:Porin n=1 Tax=Luteolibacter algae TaxID=454151 RepID=A0ABW5D6Q4_9BACT
MKKSTISPLTTCLVMTVLSCSASFAERAETFSERLDRSENLSASDIDAAFLTNPQTSWLDRASFGSYGEAHFATGDQADKFDIHRLVLFASYDFTKKVRFVTEIELEHLYSNDPGTDLTWEFEQAYFEFDLGNQYTLQAGGILVPLGIINEIHEPTTFYGVERNKIETEIIPSTFTEFGILLRKNYDSGLQWDLAVHRGLKLDTGDMNLNGPDIRNGRQKTDTFDDPASAVTARVKYTGIEGLELAVGAQYQDDISTGREENSALLTTAHFIYTTGGFSVRGLVANWQIDGDAAVNGITATGVDIDNQYGAYLEPSYKWDFDNGMAIGVFSRVLYYENEDSPDGQTEYQLGVNYWPTEKIVLKADWIHEDRTRGKANQDNFNFGVGYSF